MVLLGLVLLVVVNVKDINDLILACVLHGISRYTFLYFLILIFVCVLSCTILIITIILLFRFLGRLPKVDLIV